MPLVLAVQHKFTHPLPHNPFGATGSNIEHSAYTIQVVDSKVKGVEVKPKEPV
jgi:hypothetical protein